MGITMGSHCTTCTMQARTEEVIVPFEAVANVIQQYNDGSSSSAVPELASKRPYPAKRTRKERDDAHWDKATSLRMANSAQTVHGAERLGCAKVGRTAFDLGTHLESTISERDMKGVPSALRDLARAVESVSAAARDDDYKPVRNEEPLPQYLNFFTKQKNRVKAARLRTMDTDTGAINYKPCRSPASSPSPSSVLNVAAECFADCEEVVVLQEVEFKKEHHPAELREMRRKVACLMSEGHLQAGLA